MGEQAPSEPGTRRPSLDPDSAAIRTALSSTLSQLPGTGASPPAVIVAVSGGADSMALLHAAAFFHRRGEVRAWCVNVDHGLQTESAEVARRVSEIARSWSVPAEVVEVSVEPGPEGIEAAARTARYEALETARVRLGAEWILTAHTRSDQAETVLLGLMRGSGTRSLAGMSRISGRIVRPLLDLDAAATRGSCSAQGVEVWDDPMNADADFARVRARGLLGRLEEELGQPVTANLARTADLCRADADHLDERAEAVATGIFAASSDAATEVPLVELDELDDAILSRVLRLWLLSHGVSAQNLGADRIAELSRLVRTRAGRGPSRLSLPGDTEVVLGRTHLTFRPVETAT